MSSCTFIICNVRRSLTCCTSVSLLMQIHVMITNERWHNASPLTGCLRGNYYGSFFLGPFLNEARWRRSTQGFVSGPTTDFLKNRTDDWWSVVVSHTRMPNKLFWCPRCLFFCEVRSCSRAPQEVPIKERKEERTCLKLSSLKRHTANPCELTGGSLGP